MGSTMFDLTGRRALVTGSSQGIGFALARALAAAGAEVILNGRDAGRLDAARAALEDAGHAVHASAFDVTREEEVDAAVAWIEEGIGAIDILVNNAGMQHRAPLDQFPLDAWRALMRVNVEAVFLVARAVARRMIGRGRGRIINVASVTSELGRASIAPYAASKGAVKLLTRGMCADWAGRGIQVNAIGPGYFKTELNRALIEDPTFCAWLEARTPAGRWGDLAELGGAAVFLASDAASFVNGQVIYVDGGVTAVL